MNKLNKLSEYVARIAREYSAMDYGKMDCALFASGAVAIMRDENSVGDEFQGKYTTFAEGIEMLNQLGFENHVDLVAHHLEERPSVLHACQGDIAVFEDKDGVDALGIVQGEYIYCLGEKSLAMIKLTKAKRVFKSC